MLSVAQTKILFSTAALICIALCVAGIMTGGWALLAGMGIALTVGNPYSKQTQAWTSRLLQLSIVGLGAGMNLNTVLKTGAEGIVSTAVGISLTLLAGAALSLLLKTERATSVLITVGTAICGGSAIAAVAPTIRAKPHEISIALATVFFLNATALFIFPFIGHTFQLSQHQFGLFSALAIHDTSSVVGAALQYGGEALEVATTIKLTRALWIIPVTLVVGLLWARISPAPAGATQGKMKKPWFILGFLIAAFLVTWIPELQPAGQGVYSVAKKSLVFTLFLIGSGLTRKTLQSVGFRPFIHGICLWVLVSASTLAVILNYHN